MEDLSILLQLKNDYADTLRVFQMGVQLRNHMHVTKSLKAKYTTAVYCKNKVRGSCIIDEFIRKLIKRTAFEAFCNIKAVKRHSAVRRLSIALPCRRIVETIALCINQQEQLAWLCLKQYKASHARVSKLIELIQMLQLRMSFHRLTYNNSLPVLFQLISHDTNQNLKGSQEFKCQQFSQKVGKNSPGNLSLLPQQSSLIDQIQEVESYKTVPPQNQLLQPLNQNQLLQPTNQNKVNGVNFDLQERLTGRSHKIGSYNDLLQQRDIVEHYMAEVIDIKERLDIARELAYQLLTQLPKKSKQCLRVKAFLEFINTPTAS